MCQSTEKIIENRIVFHGFNHVGQFKKTNLSLMELTNLKSETKHFH